MSVFLYLLKDFPGEPGKCLRFSIFLQSVNISIAFMHYAYETFSKAGEFMTSGKGFDFSILRANVH